MAKKLVRQGIKEARERDVHNIYVRSDNKVAVHVYQKFGFGVTGRDNLEKVSYIKFFADQYVKILLLPNKAIFPDYSFQNVFSRGLDGKEQNGAGGYS